MKSQGSGKKIFVGISGGVDSSVSAALLQERGFDVTGVFIKIWQPEWTLCSMKEDRLDAMRVCAHLGIPFKEIDLTEAYKKDVVESMIAEYAAGRTPNPDVMCNRSIKFGAFFDWAIAEGADFVATGHYARIEDGALQVASDPSKDQSYFLWTLTKEQLERIVFPVGGLKKTEVRRLAKKFKLPTAEKKDSQGLCFVGPVDIKEFLSRYVPIKRGDVLDEHGEVIGYHDGSYFLTIGERHGFTIVKKTQHDKPLFVVSKDLEKNRVYVGPKRSVSDVSPQRIKLISENWINGSPDPRKIYEAQIRYHGERIRCRVDAGVVNFLERPDALSYGQSLVLYDRKRCIGGGVMYPL